MPSGGSGLLGITAEIEDPSSIPLTLFPSGTPCLYHCCIRQRHTPEDVKHQALLNNLRDTGWHSDPFYCNVYI